MNEIWQLILSYLLWFASCALAFLNFTTLLTATRNVAIALGANQWTVPAVHRLTLFVLGALMVVFFFWCESRYRKAAKQGLGRLLRAFGWVTVGQILLIGLAYLATLIPIS